jgi:glutamine synthetase
MENRTVGIRLKGCRGESTHLENRLGCGGANPYLQALSTLAAGLEGIRSKPELPDPVLGIAYEDDTLPRLPFTLDEAVEAFENDTDLHAVLDPEFIKLVLAVKKFEIETAKAQFPDYGTPEFNNRVDPWEWDYYMELL